MRSKKEHEKVNREMLLEVRLKIEPSFLPQFVASVQEVRSRRGRMHVRRREANPLVIGWAAIANNLVAIGRNQVGGPSS